MGQQHCHTPVVLIVAVFSHHEEAIEWARERLIAQFGPLLCQSECFRFDETTYYEASMGAELKKVLFSFQKFIDPERLAEIKLSTNNWEIEYGQDSRWPQQRPLNLDPGYVTEAKLVLASTKDRDHRIYLSQGIYAEVTLHYQKGAWRAREWTYADYHRDEVHRFLTQCRECLRQHLRELRS